jgi:acyl carrier protein
MGDKMRATAPTDLRKYLLATIATVCGADETDVQPARKVLDVNLDSLNLLSVLNQVEAAFEVQFLPEDTLDLFRAATIEEVLQACERIVKGSVAAA